MSETVPHSAHTIGALTHVEPQRVVGNPQPLVAVWSHTAGETVVRSLPLHVIALHLGGCTLVEKWRDGRLAGHSSRLGSVSLIPAFDVTRWVLSGACRVAHLYIEPSSLTQAGAVEGLRDFFAERDDTLATLVRRALSAGEVLEALERDQILALVRQHLIARYSANGVTVPNEPRITLTRATLRQVFRFIDERASECHHAMGLEELAAIARLSPDHFLRAFKTAVGQTPYQYVLERRIALSQQLLRSTRLPLGQVATASGFRNASHFAASFKQRTGVTPSAWRIA